MKVSKKIWIPVTIAVALASFTAGIVLSVKLHIANEVSAQPANITPQDIAANGFAEVVQKVQPAVVFVKIEKTVTIRNPFYDEFFEFFAPEFKEFFGPPMHKYKQRGMGSGVIVDKRGYILTNNHVVAGANKIKVKLYNGRTFNAKIVGTDPKTDLAVLKIKNPPKNLPVAVLGDSDKVKVGEWAIAIGNPFGLEHTVTVGVISAKGRSDIGIAAYEDFMQTDAAINPGNSGGPLVNIKGEVIGINTAIVATGQGIGFAIPINMAKAVMKQIIEKGRVIRGWLGVAIQTLGPEEAESLGVKGGGVLVSKVFKGSPADKAGFKPGDIIIEYNGKRIKKARDLQKLVAETKPGTKVTIKIIRNGKPKQMTVKIAEMKEEAMAEEEGEDLLGIRVRDLTPELARKYNVEAEEGVVIVKIRPNSPADEAGLKVGDVIVKINNFRIKDVSDYRKAVSTLHKGDRVVIAFWRESYYFIKTLILSD